MRSVAKNEIHTRKPLAQQTAFTKLRVEFRQQWQLYIMILPVIVGFILLKFVPLAGNVIAFQDYDFISGIRNSPWVGLKNFELFARDPYFPRIVRNTVLLGFWQVVVGFIAPILLALSLNEVRPQHMFFKRFTQTATQLPQFVAVVVVIGIIFDFFSADGIVNQLLGVLGYEPAQVLNKAGWFRPLFIGSRTWQTAGWEAIIYLAALATIDPTQYEAAIVDGANRKQQLRYITLPGLYPIMRILLVKSMADIMLIGFERAYLLQKPVTYSTSDVIQTYVYRRGVQQLDFSYAAAIGLLLTVSSLLLVIIANWIVKRTSEEGEGLW